MSRSDMLRAVEVRDAYRLIGECRDLGADPEQWYPRMLAGLRRLLGDVISSGGEGLPPRRGRPLTQLSLFESGFDPRVREVSADYCRSGALVTDPLFAHLPPCAPDGLVTYTRRQLVPDAIYHRWPVVELFRQVDIGRRMVSMYLGSGTGTATAIHLHRGHRDRDFSPREQELLRFFHQELGPLVGRALISVAEANPAHLSPRLRQTLAFLLEGDSEKQVAARLGLSVATTHQYVTALYKRFGVRSRAQLMAHALRRSGRSPWGRIGAAQS
jgi:DNA-binding CsgD family transcriptional regulator